MSPSLPCSTDANASGPTDADGRGVLLEPISQEQAPILRNLFELYVHDFSEFVPIELRSNGRFEVALGDRWWAADGHFPFFIRRNGRLSGFALVRRGSRINESSDAMDVAEFFVVRAARGKGVGTSVAHTLFRTFPGPWEIRVRRANGPAMAFWSRAVDAWTGRSVASVPFSSLGIDWEVFRVAPRAATAK